MIIEKVRIGRHRVPYANDSVFTFSMNAMVMVGAADDVGLLLTVRQKPMRRIQKNLCQTDW